ncbi:MAG: sulfatase [Lunatimonas sp.]|uniref:sulfatase n=1 Tax=Lunatimonas sp. TaxID=2060141 RepID=UPI00263A3F81|nr:sulfatase [Lunatimonas sp.]MCC5938384.1 sulfatase [Lunatimonas sp.]
MRCFLVILLLSVAFYSCQSPVEKKPNFVFILVDDLGWADIGANWGETFYETPHIDALAARGVRFSQAYAAHPVCSPTRAALMTGKHPNRVNITDWIPGFDRDADSRPIETPAISHKLALEEVTLAEKFQEGGYHTYFVGKWHLGEEETYWPESQGFDVNIGGWSVGAPQLKPGTANGYFSPYGNPRLKDGPEGEYLTDRLTEESVRLMREAGDKPFLLYLSYYTVHTPIQAVPRHHDRFQQKLAEQSQVPEEDRYQPEGVDGITRLIQDNTGYASMVAAMDENIGRIMGALKELGLEENTWVIFTSDNGGLSTLFSEGAPTANGPLRAGKGWCYEGGIRVPLLVYGPGLTGPGRVVDEPVVSMDYFTTMLSLAGIPHEAHDGNSLVPLLVKNAGGNWEREELFWHYPHYHGSAWRPGSALRKGKWKLIYYYESESRELFDLEADPRESTDLSSRMPDLANSMQHRLFERLNESGAKFPIKKGDATALPIGL